jgi:hypothetical protein
MIGTLLGIVLGALEYGLSAMIGVPSVVGIMAAIVAAVFTAALVWSGGVPRGGSAIGAK